MPRFFATCPHGFSQSLKEELDSFDLKLKGFHLKDSGVSFEASWAKAYEVNLRSKVASRVMLPVLSYQASSREQIKPQLKAYQFSKMIPLKGTFSLRVKLHRDSKFKDQKYLMNEIRVGLLEQFEKEGRGDIKADSENPTVEIFVGVFETQFSYSLNLSGEPLSNRGYRAQNQRAPLRENVAAGLIKQTGWSEDLPLVDLMCGSGTFLTEAALLSSPNPLKRRYAFKSWPNFDRESFAKICQKLQSMSPLKPLQIFGFDQDPLTVKSTKETIRNLGLEKQISIKQQALKDIKPLGLPAGVVVLNPPYGERLADPQKALEIYESLGETLKEHFKGWKAFILSPDVELTKALKMKSFYKSQINHGGLSCAFLGYQIKGEAL